MNSIVVKKGYNPPYINEFSESLLGGFYAKDNEIADDVLARAAEAYCFGDYELAQRIYDAAWNGWFMFASPVISNAPKGRWTKNISSLDWRSGENLMQYWDGNIDRGLPISCFAAYLGDSVNEQRDFMAEIAMLSVAGGGVGVHSGIRAISKKAPGSIPYQKLLDALIGYWQQSTTRRGTTAVYLDIDHPDIIEHINFRVPTGGDRKRKSDNLQQFHSAVNITDKFVAAVLADDDFDLVCPHSGEVRETLKARSLWQMILDTRALTGEPYIFKIDTANRALPESQKELGLEIKGSNICSEVSLPTDEERTFVCCLSSLNLEKYDEWKDTTLVADLTVFLDNIIQWFIENTNDDPFMKRSNFSAYRERAIGIGAMGWGRYLQSKNIPFESGGFNSSIHHTHQIFSNIKEQAEQASLKLGSERGEAPDMIGTGRRNSHLMAIAPNANSGIILGTSPSIEPEAGIIYMQNTRAGTYRVVNPYFSRIVEEYFDSSDENNFELIQNVYDSVIHNDGSVQHLDFLTKEQKNVFKTAYEIDQHWVVEQADVRQQYVCQSQSVNLFFSAGSSKDYFNSVHLKAATAPYLKGLYYSKVRRGKNVIAIKDKKEDIKTLTDWSVDDLDECLSCQG